MAPELFRGGEASRASDIYALGILAYEMLVGRPPFRGSFLEVCRGHVEGTPTAPSAARATLAPEIDGPLLQALDKDPHLRPASATVLGVGLRAAARASKVREFRAREVPRRAWLSAAAAAVLAAVTGLLSAVGLLQGLEARSVDLRFAAAPARAPDPRLMLVVLDDASLEADPTPLSGKADEFGRTLGRVFAAGARAVAIDLLLPREWSRSADFSRLVLEHEPRLTLGAASVPGGDTVGPECLAGLTAAALGPERAARLFGFVNLVEDPDGVVRRGRVRFRDAAGGERDSLPGRAARTFLGSVPAGADPAFWIDHSADWRRLPRVSWKRPGGPGRKRARGVPRATGAGRRRLQRFGGRAAPGAAASRGTRGGFRGRPPGSDGGHAPDGRPGEGGRPSPDPRGGRGGRRLHPRGLVVSPPAALAGRPRLGWRPGVRRAGVRAVRAKPPPASPRGAPPRRFSCRRSRFRASIAVDRDPAGGKRGAMTLVACALLLASVSPASPEAAGPVAVVVSLAGEVSVHIPASAAPRPLRRFDWLPPGAKIAVGPGSTVVLAFADGSRRELLENTRASVGAHGLVSTAGTARELLPLPPLPELSPLAADSGASRAGAVRIRGLRIVGLYPREGWSVRADAAVLLFDPVPSARRYRVSVEDEAGATVLDAEREGPRLDVAPGTLKPGARYYWRVRTLGAAGPGHRGEAEFTTLDAEGAARRARLAEALRREGAGGLGLLAEIDRGLGLVLEAREELRAAIEAAPADASLREALARLDRQLTEPQEQPKE